jgi:SAM-dependent methyltransferase
MSAPAKWLLEQGLVKGRVLDYGCGRGFDADALEADRYDPHYQPTMPQGEFDTILCTYVLNVVYPMEAQCIIANVMGRLAKGGCAYFTVRRDIEFDGFTGTGTFQRTVTMVEAEIVLERKNQFCIYRMEA